MTELACDDSSTNICQSRPGLACFTPIFMCSVVDIMHCLEPQTIESLNLLKKERSISVKKNLLDFIF
jgi:hypothetical protein